MYTRTWVLAVILAVGAVTGRPSEDDSSRTRRAQNGGYQAEHRSEPESLKYYGGAKGSVLAYEPGVGYVPKWGALRKDEKPEEEEEQGGDGGGGGGPSDGVAIQLPPAGASVAEARPVGLSIAGVGGVAASKPQATAVVGPAGLAIARPVATAIAGVPVGELALGPGAGSGGAQQQQQQQSNPVAVAVGPGRETGSKYSVLPANTVLLYPQ